jgi:translation initiation factor 5B
MVVGVEVPGGTLKSGVELLDVNGNKIGVLKQIQRDKEAVTTAKKGEQLAVSIDGPVFGRSANYGDVYYADISKDDLSALEGKYSTALSDEEKELLKETKRIKGLRTF